MSIIVGVPGKQIKPHVDPASHRIRNHRLVRFRCFGTLPRWSSNVLRCGDATENEEGSSQKRETDCKELQLFDGLEGKCKLFFLVFVCSGGKEEDFLRGSFLLQ